jgi:hypothetical protein
MQDDRELLKQLEQRAEQAYGRMYEVLGANAAGACFREVKELLSGAITTARRLGLEGEALRLEKRLEHIRQVYEHQMRDY